MAEPAAKRAKKDNAGLEKKILAALNATKGGGKTTDELVAVCGVEGRALAPVLNKLSSSGIVQFAKNNEGKMLIILASADEQKKKAAMGDLSNNAQHVVQVIEEKGRDGETSIHLTSELAPSAAAVSPVRLRPPAVSRAPAPRAPAPPLLILTRPV